MKLEFLENISNNGKFKNVVSNNIIWLYDFSMEELGEFKNLVKEIVEGQKEGFDLHLQEFVTPINCSLRLIIGEANSGINRIKEKEFVCEMNMDSYTHMLGQLKFLLTTEIEGYVWLDDLVETGDIDFLLSQGRGW